MDMAGDEHPVFPRYFDDDVNCQRMLMCFDPQKKRCKENKILGELWIVKLAKLGFCLGLS